MKNRIALLLLALLPFAPLHAEESTLAHIAREGNVVRMQGPLDASSARALRAHLEDGAQVIVVRSAGGAEDAGLAVAQAMLGRAVHLKVDGYCLASCAKYLFTAAQTKTLLPGALLGFAEEVSSEGSSATVNDAAFVPYARRMRADSKLFRELGIDRELIRQSLELARPDRLYFPSAATLERFGVTGIAAYPYPANQEALDALTHAAFGRPRAAVGDFPATGAAD